MAASTPCVPKFSVEALLIVHAALSVICVVKLDVVVAANEALASGKRQTIAAENFSAVLLILTEGMTHPLITYIKRD